MPQYKTLGNDTEHRSHLHLTHFLYETRGTIKFCIVKKGAQPDETRIIEGGVFRTKIQVNNSPLGENRREPGNGNYAYLFRTTEGIEFPITGKSGRTGRREKNRPYKVRGIGGRGIESVGLSMEADLYDRLPKEGATGPLPKSMQEEIESAPPKIKYHREPRAKAPPRNSQDRLFFGEAG